MDNCDVHHEEEINQEPYLGYKKTIANLINRIDELERKIISLNEEYMNSVRNNQIGLNNVYEEFKRILDGSLLLNTTNKMEKMKSDFNDFKRQLHEDISFVKKCYKIMPTISKIKELHDDDYQKLIKILELI